MADPLIPSPNGTPVLPSFTGNFGKILAGLLGCAAVVAPLLPPHTLLAKALVAFVGLGGSFGILSAGLRK